MDDHTSGHIDSGLDVTRVLVKKTIYPSEERLFKMRNIVGPIQLNFMSINVH